MEQWYKSPTWMVGGRMRTTSPRLPFYGGPFLPFSHLTGMWRYAQSKRFRLNVKKIPLRKLCLKINDSNQKGVIHICGTSDLAQDCPFFCRTERYAYCLAPTVDVEWSKVALTKKDRGGLVVGCYLLPYCHKGYQTYQGIKAWKRRCQGW